MLSYLFDFVPSLRRTVPFAASRKTTHFFLNRLNRSLRLTYAVGVAVLGGSAEITGNATPS